MLEAFRDKRLPIQLISKADIGEGVDQWLVDRPNIDYSTEEVGALKLLLEDLVVPNTGIDGRINTTWLERGTEASKHYQQIMRGIPGNRRSCISHTAYGINAGLLREAKLRRREQDRERLKERSVGSIPDSLPGVDPVAYEEGWGDFVKMD